MQGGGKERESVMFSIRCVFAIVLAIAIQNGLVSSHPGRPVPQPKQNPFSIFFGRKRESFNNDKIQKSTDNIQNIGVSHLPLRFKQLWLRW